MRDTPDPERERLRALASEPPALRDARKIAALERIADAAEEMLGDPCGTNSLADLPNPPLNPPLGGPAGLYVLNRSLSCFVSPAYRDTCSLDDFFEWVDNLAILDEIKHDMKLALHKTLVRGMRAGEAQEQRPGTANAPYDR